MIRKDRLVGIISFNMHTRRLNFGSALQSFALQQYLSLNGIESIIIDYLPFYMEGINTKYPIFNTHPNKSMNYRIKNWGRDMLRFFDIRRKYNKFEQFFQQHYKTTSKSYTNAELIVSASIEDLPIDTFVCGSDTIWKLSQVKGVNRVFFLDFPATQNCKKVAYAPSMGTAELSSEEKKEMSRCLSSFDALSVRESEYVTILSELSKKTVTCVLDPTLLHDASFYHQYAKHPKTQNYILVYNCEQNDTKMLKEAEKLGKSLKKKVIEISYFSSNRFKFHHRVKVNVGIEEWLGYMMNAELILCNSLHGLCFSVIFKKDFFVFERGKTDCKIPHLVNLLGLSERMIPCDNKVIPNKFNPIHYGDVYARLERQRKVSVDYIRDNIIDI